MQKYDHKKTEKMWREKWAEQDLYTTKENSNKKFYVLDMFPYPSGAGLHVGHPKGYIATDVIARMRMMQDYDVLHPMGWDAFGLPAENFALKNRMHPQAAMEKNIATFKGQLEMLGFTYDWSREINTTDPGFYKWTQWIFREMFLRGLAYESFEPIIWCPSCQTGLAMEDLEDGKCERCGSEIERRPMRQWVLRITDYADRLLSDLDKLPAWEESIKEMQRNWIGRSEGATVKFKVKSDKLEEDAFLEVFTTRPDTLFGATYMVIAPEHEIIKHQESSIKNQDEIQAYINYSKNKSDLERTDLNKEKTGVKIEGLTAVNPVNSEELPIFVADYVMMGYGTGAIMAVPAHDTRDFEFASKHGLEIREVVRCSEKGRMQDAKSKNQSNDGKTGYANQYFAGDGININSGFLDGLDTKDAKEKMISWLEERGLGRRAINYKLRDWVFSRQRYWGEPFPLVYCNNCAEKIKDQSRALGTRIKDDEFSKGELMNPGWIAVPEDELPVKLPDVEHYEPTGTGESPLANISEWVETVCPKCGSPARRETNTMPQWAGSSWYYLRFVDPHNGNSAVDPVKEKYWSPVDLYVGGAEHATRHLVYARFWHKFLYDIGAVSYDEPFTGLRHVGLILAEDGRKMSKRWGNVINPDEIVERYGADAMRVYEMFMGPFGQPCAWSTSGLIGAKKFLDRIWDAIDVESGKSLFYSGKDFNDWVVGAAKHETPSEIKSLLHKTIKKVTDDIEDFKFNTAISALMIFRNSFYRPEKGDDYETKKTGEADPTRGRIIDIEDFKIFIKLLSPFAPHFAEEIWHRLGNDTSIFTAAWPQYDPELAKDDKFELVIQVNGRVRDRLEAAADITEEEAKALALGSEKVRKWLEGKEAKNVVYIKNKLVNIVV